MVNKEIQLRRDSTVNLDAATPAVGEPGLANDPYRLVLGNGVAGGLGVAGLWRQGANVASASPCVIPQIGEYFDITGTAAFSAFTVLAGRLFGVQFDGAVVVTHGSGINIPGGTRTTEAGEEWLCLSLAANTVRVLAVTPPLTSITGGVHQLGNWPARAMPPTTTSPATALATKEAATNDVDDEYLAFPNAATTYCFFSFRAPKSSDESGTLTAELEWSEAGGATAHVCRWQVEMQAQGDGDTLDTAWGTAVAVDDTGVAAKRQFITTGAVTPANWAAGDKILVRIARLGSHTNDTLDAAAHLHGVTLEATINAKNDA